MIVKVKCWNNDLKMWDECAYPLFKGMNPCEIIGFQDNEGSDKLIEDGHSVLLYSGLNYSKAKELYEDDICKSSIYDDELFWYVNTKLDKNYKGCCLNSTGVK